MRSKRHAAILALLLCALPSAASVGGGARRSDQALPQSPVANINQDERLAKTFSASLNGGVEVEGCGFRATGPPLSDGSVSLSGIPAGATVVKAILNWTVMAGFDIPDPTAELVGPDGVPHIYQGSYLGRDRSPCWGIPAIHGFTADVCDAIAPGINGSYSIHVPDSGSAGTAPSAEGATLIVVWEHPDAPMTQVVVYEGLVTQDGGLSRLTVRGFEAQDPVDGRGVFVVSDGQGDEFDPTGGRGYINDILVLQPYWDGDDAASCSSPTGKYYDVDAVDLQGLVTPGDRELSAAVESWSNNGSTDCLTWSAFVAELAGVSSVAPDYGCGSQACTAPWAEAGPDLTICEGDSVTLDASESVPCDAGSLGFEWSSDARVECPLSPDPTCTIWPPATGNYSVEVSCSGKACSDSDSMQVRVLPEIEQPDLGNTLRIVKVPGSDQEMELSWQPNPGAESYRLFRSDTKEYFFLDPLERDLLEPRVIRPDRAIWHHIFFYRAAAVNCRGVEGP